MIRPIWTCDSLTLVAFVVTTDHSIHFDVIIDQFWQIHDLRYKILVNQLYGFFLYSQAVITRDKSPILRVLSRRSWITLSDAGDIQNAVAQSGRTEITQRSKQFGLSLIHI